MHAAPLSSPRLQRLLRVLSDGKPHSTWQIAKRTNNLAVGTSISELRAHGAEITCTTEIMKGKRRFFYRMTKEPDRK